MGFRVPLSNLLPVKLEGLLCLHFQQSRLICNNAFLPNESLRQGSRLTPVVKHKIMEERGTQGGGKSNSEGYFAHDDERRDTHCFGHAMQARDNQAQHTQHRKQASRLCKEVALSPWRLRRVCFQHRRRTPCYSSKRLSMFFKPTAALQPRLGLHARSRGQKLQVECMLWRPGGLSFSLGTAATSGTSNRSHHCGGIGVRGGLLPFVCSFCQHFVDRAVLGRPGRRPWKLARTHRIQP